MNQDDKQKDEVQRRRLALVYIVGGGGLFLLMLLGRLLLAETLHTKTVILTSAVFFGGFGVLLAYVLHNMRQR